MSPAIIGGGLSGLITAMAFPRSLVFESSEIPKEGHRALLRFRSDAVSNVTGIPFKRVTVRKDIFFRTSFCTPSVSLANMYSEKVSGALIGDRSIWNLEPVERYIAPENFFDQLRDSVGRRIHYGASFDFGVGAEKVISTVPMPIVIDSLRASSKFKMDVELNFRSAPIKVVRVKLKPSVDLYQTIYFPDPETVVYRASITGNILIAEFTTAEPIELGDDLDEGIESLMKVFGISERHMTGEQPEIVNQRYGKIINIPSDQRRQILHYLTDQHGIYSIGRFATFRNILLDDVVKDINVVKQLLAMDRYQLSKAASEL